MNILYSAASNGDLFYSEWGGGEAATGAAQTSAGGGHVFPVPLIVTPLYCYPRLSISHSEPMVKLVPIMVNYFYPALRQMTNCGPHFFTEKQMKCH